MEAVLDLSRWREKALGLGYRRSTIIVSGLRQVFRLRLFRLLLMLAWGAGLALAALGFLFSQSIATGGWLESIAGYLGPRAQAVTSASAALVLMYPDICIGGWFTLMFWLHSFLALWLSLVALTAMVPRLITRDRATNALTVYLSRPLTTTDYLLGKLGMIVGVITAMWTGPLLFGWLVSVAFAPDRDFILYSVEPLGRALLFNAIGLVTLAAIALGVSAVSRTSRNTIIIWLGLWLILGAVAEPPAAPRWLKRGSYVRNLGEIRKNTLQLDAAMNAAADQLPLMNAQLVQNLENGGRLAKTSDFNGALGSLVVFVALTSFVFLRRLKTE